MRILLAQINPIIGDLAHNQQLIESSIEKGIKQGCGIVLFPELSITGYPPADLLLSAQFLDDVEKTLLNIVKKAENICVLVGLPRRDPKNPNILYNSAAVIKDQHIIGYGDKILLPNYDVFNERRYFHPGDKPFSFKVEDQLFGVSICEDIWFESGMKNGIDYPKNPLHDFKPQNLDCLLNLSASPYHVGKCNRRLQVCQEAATFLNCPVLLCNQVGANDSLIFDGYSLGIDQKGELMGLAQGFVEEECVIETNIAGSPCSYPNNNMADLYQALVLGVKDYFHKQGFKKACLGLSGGVDSALVACLAQSALGSENILALYLPSRFSSDASTADSEQLAQNLGIDYKVLSIEDPLETFLKLFSSDFAGLPQDVTEENIQARIRGVILMAFANKFGYILLSTGNKSEMAMGYSTLYGDMCGGLSVIGDLTKTEVYRLCHWINRDQEIIPLNIFTRPPSAELNYNQKDTDSLPDYAILDQILVAYLEKQSTPESIANKYGCPLDFVYAIVKRIQANEFKRRQAPPGLRVTEKSFSIGWNYPIVQKWV